MGKCTLNFDLLTWVEVTICRVKGVWGVISAKISYCVIGGMLCNRRYTLLVEGICFVSNSIYISCNRWYTSQ